MSYIMSNQSSNLGDDLKAEAGVMGGEQPQEEGMGGCHLDGRRRPLVLQPSQQLPDAFPHIRRRRRQRRRRKKQQQQEGGKKPETIGSSHHARHPGLPLPPSTTAIGRILAIEARNRRGKQSWGNVWL